MIARTRCRVSSRLESFSLCHVISFVSKQFPTACPRCCKANGCYEFIKNHVPPVQNGNFIARAVLSLSRWAQTLHRCAGGLTVVTVTSARACGVLFGGTLFCVSFCCAPSSSLIKHKAQKRGARDGRTYAMQTCRRGFCGHTFYFFYFLFARPCTRMLMRYVFALLAVVTHIPRTQALYDRTSIGTSCCRRGGRD